MTKTINFNFPYFFTNKTIGCKIKITIKGGSIDLYVNQNKHLPEI